MRRATLFLTTVACVFALTSCDKDYDMGQDYATAIEGSYSGYSAATFAHVTTPVVTNGEQVIITRTGHGKATLTYDSPYWGRIKDVNIAIVRVGQTHYSVLGGGQAALTMPEGAHARAEEATTYQFTLTGLIKSSQEAEFIIVFPTVMGGLTITFNAGFIPLTNGDVTPA